MRVLLSLLAFWIPLTAVAQSTVPDSVRMSLHTYYYQNKSDIWYNCGAGVYATWPDVAARVLDTETSYYTYRLVATDGMYIPRGYGEATSRPDVGITVPEGHYGHNPQLGGARSGLNNFDGCGNLKRGPAFWISGGESLLNARPFRITEWYAVYDIPAGTPIAEFTWEQPEGLTIDFDGNSSREVEVDGKKPVVDYAWDFGDGQTGSAVAPTHTFEEAGTYQVTLTVTDDDDETDEVTYAVEVKSVVLEHFVFATEEVFIGDTLGVTVLVKNVGVTSAKEVVASRDFAFLESYPEIKENVRNGDRTALRALGDTTFTDVEPGGVRTVSQFYVIDNGAVATVDGEKIPVPVDWEALVPFVRGTDADDNPATVNDLCEDGSCDNVTRVGVQAMTLGLLAARVDGETSAVPAGLRRWTSDIFPNGIYYHLVPPLSAKPKCNSGCIDLEITVTDPDGAPVEGAEVELTRVLLDTHAEKKSIVTPDQGGGVFCFETECKATLKLPPTDAEGKQTARFWVSGVIHPVDAYITATAKKTGFTTTDLEEQLVIQPTKVDLGQRTTATPTNTDMTVLSAIAGFESVLKLPDLKTWCTKLLDWSTKKDAELTGVKINAVMKKALAKSIDWTCGQGLTKYIYDEEFALEDEIKSREEKLKILKWFSDVGGVLSLYWFQSQFQLPLAGTGETSLTKSPPFLTHSSEMVDVIREGNQKLAWQYFKSGSVPTITFDLYEVSHKKPSTENVQALYFMLKTDAVDFRKLITKNYNKSIFLTQERAETTTLEDASEGDEHLVVNADAGKRATADSTFAVGHVLVIEPGTEVAETVQVVSIEGGTLGLSVPLAHAHPAGARLAYTDSLAVGPPAPPYNAGGLSGLPGASTTPTLAWLPGSPAMRYTVEVATDTLFNDIVQTHSEIAGTSVTLGPLTDRTRYYWRAAGTNLLGQGEWSDRYSFFTGAPWGDNLTEARVFRDELEVSLFAWHYAATAEPDEAAPTCGSGSNSLWYTYTPESSRKVSFETFASGYDTAVSVWTGASHPMTEVACNDDYANGEHTPVSQSYVEFDAVAGTTYYIRVSGKDGAEGPLLLTLRAPTTVDVDDPSSALPTEYALEAAYPNPFNPQTIIGYSLPETADVHLAVYDALGRQVAVLDEGRRSAGRYEVTFQADGLPSGVYLYRLAAAGRVLTGRVVLLK